MYLKNVAIGVGMTLGVQLVPGAWIKTGDYVVPNTSYQMKGDAGFQSKTGTKGGASGTSGTSGGIGTSGSRGSGGSGAFGGFGGGSLFGTGGGGLFGSGSGGGPVDDACGGGPLTLTEGGNVGSILYEQNLNDALPYDWVKNLWLCGCPFSMAGTGLYWDSRPLIMCVF